MSEAKAHRYELDLLRLLAALWVVAFHVLYGNHILGFNPVGYPKAVQAVAKYAYVAMPIFFFISGFVILSSASGRTARSFATSRLARLYPAYWACVTITFLLINTAGTRHISIADYLINMTMLEGFLFHPLVDAVYWTLQVELIFYGLVWLTLVTGQMKRFRSVLWGWTIVCALTTLVQISGHTVPNRIVVATGYGAYFVVGAAAYLYVKGDKGRSVVTLLAASSALSLVRAYFDGRSLRAMYHSINVGVGVALVAVGLVLCLAIALEHFPKVPGRPWMVWAGLLTYPVYLLHDEVSNVLFTRWHTLNRWVLLLVVMAMVVAVSWAVNVAIERPLAPRLRRVLNKGWDRVVAFRAPTRPSPTPSPAAVGPIGPVTLVDTVGPVSPAVPTAQPAPPS